MLISYFDKIFSSTFYHSLEGFPIFKNEYEGDSLNSVYIHGKLDFGNFSRTVFMRPLSCTENEQSTVLKKNIKKLKNDSNSDSDQIPKIGSSQPSKWISPISNKIFFLIAQADIPIFIEKLKTDFFTLQIFRDDIQKRAFNSRNTDHYRDLRILEKENCIMNGTKIENEFEVMKSDLYLINCLRDALEDSSRTMVRYLGPIILPISFAFYLYFTSIL